MKQKDILDEIRDELAPLYDDEMMAEAEKHLPEGFDQRMEMLISQLEASDKPKAMIGVRKVEKGFAQTSFVRRYAAAITALIIVAGTAYMMRPTTENMAFTDTCRSPQEAEMQMNRALAMISQRTKSGLDGAREQIDRSMVRPEKDYSKYLDFTN